jgi:hypothetical protein
VDAIATPFVQGQLRGEDLSFVIETVCTESGRPIQIEMDGELDYHVMQEEADPRIFVPIIDADRLEDPSIIDAF